MRWLGSEGDHVRTSAINSGGKEQRKQRRSFSPLSLSPQSYGEEGGGGSVSSRTRSSRPARAKDRKASSESLEMPRFGSGTPTHPGLSSFPPSPSSSLSVHLDKKGGEFCQKAAKLCMHGDHGDDDEHGAGDRLASARPGNALGGVPAYVVVAGAWLDDMHA